MTDIRDYPNPLLQQLSDQFSLGLTFDANGVPQFNGKKITLAQFNAFLDAALGDETNLYRLMPDGTFNRPEIKVFYDRSIEVDSERVFNSVLANDFAERAGSTAVSLDRTALGQLLFRSRLDDVVEGWNEDFRDSRNVFLSAQYAEPAIGNRCSGELQADCG